MAGRTLASQSVFEKIRELNPDLSIAHLEEPAFLRYGRVLRDCRTSGLQKLLAARRIAPDSAEYEPDCFTQSAPREEVEAFARDVYGGMSDLQVGCVHGRNTKLNALEYHKSAEVVVPGADMVVFVGLASDIEWPAGSFDTSRAQAFFVPRGMTFTMFPWCLHYAPAHVSRQEGFRCAVVLPRGTNTDLDFTPAAGGENRLLLGKNKWVLAHADEPSLKAKSAHVGLSGRNTELKTL
jgi:hypothetical protein